MDGTASPRQSYSPQVPPHPGCGTPCHFCSQIIHFLHTKAYAEALELIQSAPPASTQEYILHAVVYATMGQQQDNSEYIRLATEYFQIVGSARALVDMNPIALRPL